MTLAYGRGETDEFVLPTVVQGVEGQIRDGDSVIMYNFRPDRARQLTRIFCDGKFSGFVKKTRKTPTHEIDKAKRIRAEVLK